MLVRINLPSTDESAREIHRRFVSKGPCPYGNGRFVLGMVKGAEERDEGLTLTVEVTDPSVLEYLTSEEAKADEGRGLLSLTIRPRGSPRRPRHRPYQRVP